MKIGVRLESLDLPFRKALREASRMGAAGVQMDAVGDLAPDALSLTGRRELRNLLNSSNLELAAIGCPLRFGLDEATNLQPRIEHVQKVMALAFDLGPRRVIVEMPRIPDEPKAPEAAPGSFTGSLLLGSAPLAAHPFTVLREALSVLGAYGDRIGTNLALEVGLDSGERIESYLKAFPVGSLGVNYDPANMLLNGLDPIANILPLQKRIIHTHARDARRSSAGHQGTETPLGAGNLDWLTYVATLASIEYQGWLVVERQMGENRVADVAAGVSFLRKFVR